MARPVIHRHEEVHGQAVLMRPVRSNTSTGSPASLTVDEDLPWRGLLESRIGSDNDLEDLGVHVSATEPCAERAVGREVPSGQRKPDTVIEAALAHGAEARALTGHGGGRDR